MDWTEALKMGVPAIDGEHKHAVWLMDRLGEAIWARDPQVVCRLLLDVCDHFTRHFADEERLMAEVEYPMTAAHRAEHAEMSAWIEQAAKAVTANPGLSSPTAVKAIKWISDHLTNSDMLVAEFIRTKRAISMSMAA